jgi:hypothetical protein
MHTEVPIQRWLWTICGIISLIAALHTIFQWTKVLPSELYDEEKQKNVKKTKLTEEQRATNEALRVQRSAESRRGLKRTDEQKARLEVLKAKSPRTPEEEKEFAKLNALIPEST